MNTKLHAICGSQGRPISLFVTAGQVSDYIGARALLSSRVNLRLSPIKNGGLPYEVALTLRKSDVKEPV